MPRKVLTDYPEAMQKQIVAKLAPLLPAAPMSGKTAVIGAAVAALTDSAIKSHTFIVPIQPMGKPRMTQQDKWRKRPCVFRYWEYAAAMREACKGINQNPNSVEIIVYLAIPSSHSKKAKAALVGKPHRQKPDVDNIWKGCTDPLWEKDEVISFGSCRKFWDDGAGARIEITIS